MTGARTARIRTEHGDSTTAKRIADAVRPDNTEEMSTTVEGSTVETTIERQTTGGLRSTADDYVVNVRVAAQLATNETHDT
ncbi:MAG: KEOPS complex subunit Pcc1 [Salinirussus sp.]